MRLTKIYTKVGDRGKTMLATGEKVAKDSLRIETYGTIDELNAFLGELCDSYENTSKKRDFLDSLKTIQQELFDLGGELATPTQNLDLSKQQVITSDDIKRLEREIDNINENLEPLTNFVLPGGHQLNSKSHVCRTICRRAERQIVRLSKQETVREDVAIYVNRLSDWFFVFARAMSWEFGAEEIIWNQKRR